VINWLIITTVDPLVRPNNREHGLLRHLASRFQQVDIVFRRSITGGMRHVFWPSTETTQKGNINFVSVNPPLNHRQGLIRDMSGVSNAKRNGALSRALSSLAFAAMGPLGIAKDVLTILALMAAGKRRIVKGRKTVCSAFGPWAAAAAWLLRKAGHIQSFIYEDRDYEPGFIDSRIRRAWARWLENKMILAADEVVTIGERLLQLREQETGRRPQFIPTGAEPSDRCGNGQRKPILVYIGNVADWSALDILVGALADISKSVPDVKLRIVGSGSREAFESIATTARQMAVTDRVEILGAVPHTDIPALLSDASVGVATFLPNALRTYAMPLKVVEYMAAGLPSLATIGTEAGDIVAKHQCGIEVPLDRAAMVHAAVELLTDQSRWRQLAANAVNSAPHYFWSRLAEMEWSVIENLASAQRPLPSGRSDLESLSREVSGHVR
jgi:glycosyltransferase involved in cell wall biosynthesis